MKALTLTQPWATLVAISAKRIETRSWSTPYRGPLAIHAAKTMKRWDRELCAEEPFARYLSGVPNNDYRLALGAIVATAALCAVLRINSFDDLKLRLGALGIAEHEEAFGDYSPGRFAWILADVRPIVPCVPASGALGLWEWPVSLAEIARFRAAPV